MELFSPQQQKALALYQKYDRFYDNQFNQEEKDSLDVDARFYIAANITRSIIDVTPDFLLGETPKITSDKQERQDVIDAITKTSDMGTIFYDASLIASLKGKSYIKLYLKQGSIYAQVIQPDNVVPTYDLYGQLSEVTVLTLIESFEDQTELVLKEQLTSDFIKRSLVVLDKQKQFREVRALDSHPMTSLLKAKEENPFKVLPIIELKNNTKAQSDIAGCEALILAINKRLSEIDYIITKHADPKLRVPIGLLDRYRGYDAVDDGHTVFVYQEDGIENKDFKVIEAGTDDEIQYIQPNLNLEAAYEELDRLVNYLLNQTKTSTALIQSIKDGSGVESGKALRLKLLNTERKLRQKKVFITKALREYYRLAQMMLHYEPSEIDIEYADILNDREMNMDNAVKLYNANIISKREALRVAYPNASEEMILSLFTEYLEELQ